MRTIVKGAAIASVVILGAGAAWAQGYTPTPGTPGYNGNSSTSINNPNAGAYGNPGAGTYSNPAATNTYNSNQESWSSGRQGTSTPNGGQSYSQAGYGIGNVTTFQQAEQELRKYGYNNVHDLRAMQGWAVDAMKNGQRVHVIIGDNGLIATFPGR
jgi:hypothetical protein